MNKLEKVHPGLIEEMSKDYLHSVTEKNNQLSSRSTSVINVVFHLVGNSIQELTDDVIMNQIDNLNRDYNRQNADTIQTRGIFKPLAGGMDIEFRLAEVDPIGNITTGINRYFNDFEAIPEITFLDITMAIEECDIDIMNFDPLELDTCFVEALYGDLDLDNIKRFADGGADPWDVDKYINIWVGDLNLSIEGIKSPFLLGFAYPPYGVFEELDAMFSESELRTVDGIVLHYEILGPDNPLNEGFSEGLADRGRTLTHEMGHYLGLRHVWGDGDCFMDDMIEDTPPMGEPVNTNILDSINVCQNLHMVDSCPDDFLPDMIENYMNYSSDKCQNMFTQEQVQLMEFILNNQRQTLLEDQPLSTTNELSSVNIYPNPVTDELRIDVTDTSELEVEIFNADGRKVISTTSTTIPMYHLPSGIYMMQSKVNNKVSHFKLIKT